MDLTLHQSNDDQEARSRFLPRGLSGKLLVLTIFVIMLIEVFVFIPSVANFRLIWLSEHFVTGEATSLALEKLGNDQVSDEERDQLLALIKTDVIVVRRDDARRVLASRAMPRAIDVHVPVAEPGRVQAVRSITAALDTLIWGGDRIMRVFGPMSQREGTLELVMNENPLRLAMLTYAGNVLLISLAISVFTGIVVFLALRALLIKPLQRLSGSMLNFAGNPEDGSAIIRPSGRKDEIGVAEEQLSTMQKQLRGTMSHQRRMADLGLAVSKINHDMRNILASASLFSDRLSSSSDPVAQRLAPRLVRTIDRAADYAKSVLEYGKSGEALPTYGIVRLSKLCDEVAEALAIDDEANDPNTIEWRNSVDSRIEIEADAEQLFRVLLNLSRNAVQAMQSLTDDTLVKRLSIAAQRRNCDICIMISDTGPGLPATARENLFTAFKGSNSKGGTGLGLTIAAEIVRAHGGTIVLMEDNRPGAHFEIVLPMARPRG